MAPVDSNLVTRQSSSGESCPSTISSGGIAGIVLGSIAGTLLLIWLWRACRLPGATGSNTSSGVVYESPIVRSSYGQRRRRGSSGTTYVEKPTSTRLYKDEVRKPARIYAAGY
ncbi:hypothetical protein N7481_002899 [Penicillium waksmanii]|uniref:uncharacterized protein n=1 Tax=Penicillium waksmanii TaxID=69791 RepID=UPI0025494AC5|nr:uncharacterized protein N7481_013481 [Penicillium waksmanii]XP_057127050.1 uncharacterized protein N7481_002899 [Penicillium waksmanii]KAJ5963176.1 hypothetical protein N7481_013481 [Penicillium waksmanii]KAJ5995922.1 hypothetical protein N7481_002899 [Penicillium waksmanii]